MVLHIVEKKTRLFVSIAVILYVASPAPIVTPSSEEIEPGSLSASSMPSAVYAR
jgi:hypothetical protein